MSNVNDKLRIANQAIREVMEVKSTEELIEIHTLQDTSGWIPAALKIVDEILIERGIVLPATFNELEARDDFPLWIDDDVPEEEKTPLDLSRIDWSQDSIETVYQELSCRTVPVSIWTETEGETGKFADETFDCIQCGTKLHWTEQFCTNCGIELFPQTADNKEDDLNSFEIGQELEISKDVNRYREMSLEELEEFWFGSDPTDWTLVELEALRRVFDEKGIMPAFLLDAPADAMKRLPYLNIECLIIRGTPGYRFRPGRCGLDLIDTRAEVGRLFGSMIRDTFRFRSLVTSPWSLLVMIFIGVTLSSLIFVIPYSASFDILLFLLPYFLVGLFLLLNSIISLHSMIYDRLNVFWHEKPY